MVCASVSLIFYFGYSKLLHGWSCKEKLHSVEKQLVCNLVSLLLTSSDATCLNLVDMPRDERLLF